MALAGCGRGDSAETLPPPPTGPTPEEYRAGHAAFEQFCIACHGPAARGTETGPPLVHRVYEPSHHADAAFYRAVAFGVRAHHWRFGDMQPLEGIERETVAEIVGYVRWLQREAGIR